MKRFAIDTNFNFLGPDKPALSQKEVENLGLQENERVMVYQDEDEWKGIICFDDRLPSHYQWYVKLIVDLV